MDPFPEIPTALLVVLDQLFPERTPDKNETLDEIRFKSGQRDVVRFLKVKFDEQHQEHDDVPSTE